MNTLSLKLGFWSALSCALAFVLFTLCFVAIAATQPLFVWTNAADYAKNVQETNQVFKHTAQLTMLLFGPLFMILLSSIHDLARAEQKVLARTALALAAVFAALSGAHYFIQLSTVRHILAGGALQDLAALVQANPASPVLAINMLGFTLFLGLASLFVAPVFGGSRLQNTIRYAFLANAVFCLLGGVGYVLQITWLVFVTINLGMGGALLVATVALGIFFRGMAMNPAIQPIG